MHSSAGKKLNKKDIRYYSKCQHMTVYIKKEIGISSVNITRKRLLYTTTDAQLIPYKIQLLLKFCCSNRAHLACQTEQMTKQIKCVRRSREMEMKICIVDVTTVLELHGVGLTETTQHSSASVPSKGR